MKNQEDRNSYSVPLRVLVVLHVYYEDFLPYYLGKLKNISACDWDLVVTGNNLSERTKQRITDSKPDAVFCQTSNVGYDVWPFIYAIKQIDLDQYTFVIKLHTKNQDSVINRLNGTAYTGSKWRSELVNALLGSKKRFSRLCRIFLHKSKVGIAYAIGLDIIRGHVLAEDSSMLTNEMKRLGIEACTNHFCGGTIFAVRASALKWLKDDRISEGLFQTSEGSHNTATMAHVYERILSMAVISQGYRAYLIRTSWHRYLSIKGKRNVQPVLEWLFSIDYHGVNQEKYLTVFGFRIKLRKKRADA